MSVFKTHFKPHVLEITAIPNQHAYNQAKVKISKLTIQLSGAVKNPGIYKVARGSRVLDVLTQSGGVLPNANLDKVNLVAKVKDGKRINIPEIRKVRRAGSPRRGISGNPRSSKKIVPINTATLSQLKKLPGVGAATAKNIRNYRVDNGPFGSLKDLLKVKGIGPKKLAKLKLLLDFSN